MYDILLIDDNDSIRLDIDDFELETVFSVSDISDISSRKDSITKTITIKGTENNNVAFGNLFFLNRNVDISLPNKLFFNYSPLRSVDCMLIEDGVMILRGLLFVTEVNVDENGIVTYDCTITGKTIGLKQSLGDSLLTDINFYDLQHQYNLDVIRNSWGGYVSGGINSVGLSVTQRYDVLTNSYYNKAFELGSGYVYPFIDYGETFLAPSGNLNYRNIKLQNFRPAIFLREYFNRIFKNTGYTYEIAGSDFNEMFNQLIVPNTDEKHTYTTTEKRSVISYGGYIGQDYKVLKSSDNTQLVHPLPFNIFTDNYYAQTDVNANTIRINRNFSTDALVYFTITSLDNLTSNNSTVKFQLVRRSLDNSNNPEIEYDDVIAETSLAMPAGRSVNFYPLSFVVPITDYKLGDRLQVRVVEVLDSLTAISGTQLNTYSLANLKIEFSKDYTSPVTIEASDGDYIIPVAPSEIKQIDFLKGIMAMFNLYMYSSITNPNHFIIERYKDYYDLCRPSNLRYYSIDWTNKIDYSAGLTMNGNLTIPKKYRFTYKSDNDYYNSSYNSKFGEVYGQNLLTDSLGISDEKKIELPFSASPLVSNGGTYRNYPFFGKTGDTLTTKKPSKVNCRILFYNGVHACEFHTISIDAINSSNVYIANELGGGSYYPNCSAYYFDESARNYNTPRDSFGVPVKPIPTNSLFFGSPKEFYSSSITSNYLTVRNLYTENYSDQIKELSNANLYTIECSVLLNSADIANLDFGVPVYIDGGEIGANYFKILEIEYRNNNEPSIVTLQSINL